MCVCVCAREGGRAEGTTAERGFGVGREGGRLEGTSDYVCFWVCDTLSTTWSIKPLLCQASILGCGYTRSY